MKVNDLIDELVKLRDDGRGNDVVTLNGSLVLGEVVRGSPGEVFLQPRRNQTRRANGDWICYYKGRYYFPENLPLLYRQSYEELRYLLDAIIP